MQRNLLSLPVHQQQALFELLPRMQMSLASRQEMLHALLVTQFLVQVDPKVLGQA
jgi:hypothetical protein